MLLPVFHFGQASLCLDPGAPFFLARTQLCVRAAPLTFFRRKGGFDAQPIAPSREAFSCAIHCQSKTHTWALALQLPFLSSLPLTPPSAACAFFFQTPTILGARPLPPPLLLSSAVLRPRRKGIARGGRRRATDAPRWQGCPRPLRGPPPSAAPSGGVPFFREARRAQCAACVHITPLSSLSCVLLPPFQTRPDQTPGSVFVGAPLATTTPIPMQTCPPVN